MGEVITKIKEKWLVGYLQGKIMCKIHQNKEQQKNSGKVITKIKEEWLVGYLQGKNYVQDAP